MRSRRYSLRQFEDAIASSISWAEVGRKLGLAKSGSLHKSLQKYAKESNCNTDHFLGQAHYRGTNGNGNGFPRKWSYDEILVENSPFTNSSHLKRRMIKDALLKDECLECHIGSEWNGKLLVLHLDHVNGIHNDNRFENLRVLCPNCHSQTATVGNKARSSNG